MLSAAIAKYLDSLDLGTYGASGADLFVEALPDTPDNATAIQAKTAPAGDYSPNQPVAFQVIVRRVDDTGNRARAGYEPACAIRDALHGLRHVTLDDGGPDETRLSWIRLDQGWEPINLGDDTNQRPRWSLRFVAQSRVVTAHTIL